MGDWCKLFFSSPLIMFPGVLIAQLCIHYLSTSRSTKERTLKHAKDEIAELVSWSFFMVGNSAVLLFGVLYVLVNVMDVKGYTGWEAVFENLAVAAQLLFMGSLAAHMEEDPILEDGLPFLNFYQPSPRPFWCGLLRCSTCWTSLVMQTWCMHQYLACWHFIATMPT